MEINNNDDNNLPEEHLHDIHRVNRDEISELLSRVITLRDQTRQDIHNIENNLIGDHLYDLLLSNSNFLFILLILIFIAKLEYLVVVNKDITIHLLESDEMWLFYSLLFFGLAFAFWFIYLFIYKIFTCFEKTKLVNIEKDINVIEILYLNPFFFSLIVIYIDKSYIVSPFDVFLMVTVSMKFLVVFLFSYFFYNYNKFKFTHLTNINFDKFLVYRMRMGYCAFILMTLFSGYLVTFFTSEVGILFVYLMHFKTFYIILRQIEFWYTSEVAYKQLNNYYATNEDYYLSSNLRKSTLTIFNMVNSL
jgi:hypothetical protein